MRPAHLAHETNSPYWDRVSVQALWEHLNGPEPEPRSEEEALRARFEQYDLNRDGVLDEREARRSTAAQLRPPRLSTTIMVSRPAVHQQRRNCCKTIRQVTAMMHDIGFEVQGSYITGVMDNFGPSSEH